MVIYERDCGFTFKSRMILHSLSHLILKITL